VEDAWASLAMQGEVVFLRALVSSRALVFSRALVSLRAFAVGDMLSWYPQGRLLLVICWVGILKGVCCR